ncbi:MAG TPA: class I SAM-dependent rRNA methyltransferase [Bacteroidia bacterium]|jgi:23S rRNA (cytosine1962-C5)-methyltransferase|nr:class I SAM-dependent rRNA methyltransferase [Bacteroidia bacterium]
MNPTPIITLHAGKEQSSLRFHPWIFSGAIKSKSRELEEGEVVEVHDSKGIAIGMGHYQIGSIAVRLFSFKKAEIDFKFWKNKLVRAYNLRKKLGLADSETTTAYRLVFGEGDGMPGLIIDYYQGTAVMQCHSIGFYLIREQLAQALQEIYGDKLCAVYDKSEETMPHLAKVQAVNGIIWGATTTNEVLENGYRFFIDWEGGQKTGFFVDQRESRELVKQYSKDKTVLNTFCYSGGFSIYALAAGAHTVHSVDSSKKAIALTDRNVELNKDLFPSETGIHASYAEDVFDFLKGKDKVYDLIILDPPAFAKHQNVKHNAVQGYKRLNLEALKQIKPGGILFTFSCSQVIDRSLFRGAVMAAAIESGRSVRILHQISQPADHPVSIFHPEGEYLKGLVLYVE